MNVLSDNIVDFDITTILPASSEPMVFDPGKGTKISKTITIPQLYNEVDVYLLVKDKFEIEYPLCFSNYGRLKESDGGDGSYYLGKIKL